MAHLPETRLYFAVSLHRVLLPLIDHISLDASHPGQQPNEKDTREIDGLDVCASEPISHLSPYLIN
jgi:hypothetical protein